MNFNFAPFLKMLNIIKVMHWSTKSYVTHVALDEAYKELSDVLDRIVELFIGKEIIDTFQCTPIEFDMPRKGRGQEAVYFDEYFTIFCDWLRKNYDSNEGIKSLIDEVENIGNKVNYLLRLS